MDNSSSPGPRSFLGKPIGKLKLPNSLMGPEQQTVEALEPKLLAISQEISALQAKLDSTEGHVLETREDFKSLYERSKTNAVALNELMKDVKESLEKSVNSRDLLDQTNGKLVQTLDTSSKLYYELNTQTESIQKQLVNVQDSLKDSDMLDLNRANKQLLLTLSETITNSTAKSLEIVTNLESSIQENAIGSIAKLTEDVRSGFDESQNTYTLALDNLKKSLALSNKDTADGVKAEYDTFTQAIKDSIQSMLKENIDLTSKEIGKVYDVVSDTDKNNATNTSKMSDLITNVKKLLDRAPILKEDTTFIWKIDTIVKGIDDLKKILAKDAGDREILWELYAKLEEGVPVLVEKEEELVKGAKNEMSDIKALIKARFDREQNERDTISRNHDELKRILQVRLDELSQQLMNTSTTTTSVGDDDVTDTPRAITTVSVSASDNAQIAKLIANVESLGKKLEANGTAAPTNDLNDKLDNISKKIISLETQLSSHGTSSAPQDSKQLNDIVQKIETLKTSVDQNVGIKDIVSKELSSLEKLIESKFVPINEKLTTSTESSPPSEAKSQEVLPVNEEIKELLAKYNSDLEAKLDNIITIGAKKEDGSTVDAKISSLNELILELKDQVNSSLKDNTRAVSSQETVKINNDTSDTLKESVDNIATLLNEVKKSNTLEDELLRVKSENEENKRKIAELQEKLGQNGNTPQETIEPDAALEINKLREEKQKLLLGNAHLKEAFTSRYKEFQNLEERYEKFQTKLNESILEKYKLLLSSSSSSSVTVVDSVDDDINEKRRRYTDMFHTTTSSFTTPMHNGNALELKTNGHAEENGESSDKEPPSTPTKIKTPTGEETKGEEKDQEQQLLTPQNVEDSTTSIATEVIKEEE